MKITLSNIKFAGICEIDEESYRVAKADQSLISLKNAINDEYRKKVAEELLPTTSIKFSTNKYTVLNFKPGEFESALISFSDRKGVIQVESFVRNIFVKEENKFIDFIISIRSFIMNLIAKENHKQFAERVLKKAKALEKRMRSS